MMNTNGLKLETSPAETPWKKERFIMVLKYMHGDADLYTEEELFALDRSALNDFYAVVDRYFALGWNARIEAAEQLTLNAMPEYWVFTSADSKEAYVKEDRSYWEEYWPCDKTNDCFGRTMLMQYQVYYYDGDGKKYLVSREEKS